MTGTTISHPGSGRPAVKQAPVARRRLVTLALAAAVVAALWAPSGATASDRTLRVTIAKWSQRISVDARGISVSAARRHPRRMVRRAQKFRVDALRARRAVAVQRPTTARGRRARSLALVAFRDYAVVGRHWSLSGRARLGGKKRIAIRHARVARGFALRGNRRLTTAAKLLR